MGPEREELLQSGPRSVTSAQLLIEEYRHLAESLLRNEERGERRAEWFLIYSAALVVVLVAVRPDLRVAAFAVGTILLLGLITRSRLIHRNLTADEYGAKIRGIEQFFVNQDEGLAAHLPFSAQPRPGRWTTAHKSFVTGGALQTVEFVNALAAGVLISLLPAVITDSNSISLVAVVLGALAFFAAEFGERKFRSHRDS